MIDLKSNPIVYVTRDIERALGLDLDTPGYYIISNSTPFAKSIAKEHSNIFLIEEEKQLDTWQLLQNEQIKKYIDSIDNTSVIVFKNTKQIEKTCEENNWKLLNPSAELSDKIEEKISQLKWLGELKKYLPKTSIQLCKDIDFTNEKFILQFNRAHTGSGTFLIQSKEQIDELKIKFPERECRVTKYIEGPTFNNNNVVTKNKILIGNINYQITGLQPFTDQRFATIGNDWAFPHRYLNEDQIEQYKKIVNEIGEKLKADGWKGLFGVDIVVDDKTGKLYLIEINARQPASTTLESKLQQEEDDKQPSSISIFEAQLLSLLETDKEQNLIEIKDGAQLIQRVTDKINSPLNPKLAHDVDFRFIKYSNTKPGSDLLRLQTKYSLILNHNEFNEYGKMMIDFVTVALANKTWDSERAGIIAVRDNKILLMERHKFDHHFFCLPGGTVDLDEELKTTARREGKEETTLDFDIPEQEPLFFEVRGRKEYYYFVKNISGAAVLSGEEKERSTKENLYELKWIDLEELPNIELLPEGITEQILKHYDK